MAVTSSTKTTTLRDGKRYTTFVITEDETTSTTDEFSIAIPEWGTITLLEANLLGAGAAATIRPAFGVTAAFVVDQDGFVDQASAADANQRIAQNKRVTSRAVPPALFGSLFYRSTPDVNLTGSQSIVTRITFAWGQYV